MKLSSLVKTVADNAGNFFTKNGRIVAGIGAGVGIIVTAVLAYQARPKVDRIIKAQKEKVREIENDETKDQETKEAEIREVTKETIKETSLAMLPTIISIGTTVGLVADVLISGEKSISTLSQVASVGSVAYQNLDTSAKELLDEKDYEKLKDKELSRKILIGPEGYIDTGKGKIPYYDAITGRPFLCSEEAIIAAVNETNIEFAKIQEGKKKIIPYETLYRRIGLPPTPATAYIFWDKPIELNLANSSNWGQGSLRVLDHMIRPKFGMHR